MNKLGWLLWVACIACGDDGSSVRPDAPQASDAPTDSGADCEAAAPVTVTGPTYDPDTVTFTASLVSHDASGAMCGTKEAAAGSEASTTIDVPPGGMVTMVDEVFAPTKHEAAIEADRETRMPAPAP